MGRHVLHLPDLPEESLSALGSAVTIKRVINPELVSSTSLSINALRLPAGFGLPVHVHYKSEEAWVVLEGKGIIRVDGEDHLFEAGDILYVPAGMSHQVVCRGTTVLRYLAITSPPIDFEHDNIILEPFDPSRHGT